MVIKIKELKKKTMIEITIDDLLSGISATTGSAITSIYEASEIMPMESSYNALIIFFNAPALMVRSSNAGILKEYSLVDSISV
jgi:hypothetical protein